MPLKTKATRARISNLRAIPALPRSVTVEEVPEELEEDSDVTCAQGFYDRDHSHHSHVHQDDTSTWSFDLGDQLPDLDVDDDANNEEFMGIEEIQTEEELHNWNDFLEKTQEAAREAEREKEGNRKRKTPSFYPKNSYKTQKQREIAAEELKKKGYLSVWDFLKTKKKATAEEQITAADVS